jgi:hypothetical protein
MGGSGNSVAPFRIIWSEIGTRVFFFTYRERRDSSHPRRLTVFIDGSPRGRSRDGSFNLKDRRKRLDRYCLGGIAPAVWRARSYLSGPTRTMRLVVGFWHSFHWMNPMTGDTHFMQWSSLPRKIATEDRTARGPPGTVFGFWIDLESQLTFCSVPLPKCLSDYPGYRTGNHVPM